MWLFFFIIAVLGTCVLLVHISLELNNVEKNAARLSESLRKHYGLE